MTIVAGIDEAGYGPRLGPLVVSATAFRVPPELAEADLWETLAGGVAARCSGADGRLVIADSKALYQNRKGLNLLEEGALAALALAGQVPAWRALGSAGGPGNGVRPQRKDIRGSDPLLPACRQTRPPLGLTLEVLLAALGADRPEEYEAYPWYADRGLALPAASKADRVVGRAQRLHRALDRCGAAVAGVWSVPLLEGRFNRILAKTDNKSDVAFTAVAFLIQRLRAACPGEVVRLTVDKQGGRSHYLRHLAEHFPEADIEVRSETYRRSKYVLRQRTGKTELVFQMEGERGELPVALASMVSKYVRELLMRLFNEYWRGQVAGLPLTSGYWADSGPFLDALQAAGALDELDTDLLIRRR